MEQPQLDFATVMASSIHDMKNSLGVLLAGLEDLQKHVEPSDQQQIDVLRHQSQRLNNQLMQMLSIYKLQQGIASANLDWHSANELLQDAADAHEPLLASKGIHISVDSELERNDLLLCCDRDLVLSVLDNALTNAFRYVTSEIELSAQRWPHDKGQGVVLCVCDDGDGFPSSIRKAAGKAISTADVAAGHSGLGLYFCSLVAGLHCNHGLAGHIGCDNAGINGGGRLSVYIP